MSILKQYRYYLAISPDSTNMLKANLQHTAVKIGRQMHTPQTHDHKLWHLGQRALTHPE